MFAKISLLLSAFLLVETIPTSRKIYRAAIVDRRSDKEGCFLVKLRDGAGDRKAELSRKVNGEEIAMWNHTNNFGKCNLRSEDVEALADDDDVEYIEDDMVVTGYGQQATEGLYWNLDRIDQHSVPYDKTFTWKYTGRGVPIYVLDTGVNSRHQEFAGRMGKGIDLYASDPSKANPDVDCNGHGTHVAGIAGGTNSGVAKLSTIVSVRVMGCNKGGMVSKVIAGINWVMSQPRGVIVMSFGGSTSQTLNDAVAAAVAKNYVVVSAAGNDNDDACTKSPASSRDSITVSACNDQDRRSNYANFGKCVDIFAPGDNIRSASNVDDDGYVLKWGTSMAAPLVAGAAAAILSGMPFLSAGQIAAILKNEAISGVLANVNGSPNLLLRIAGTPDVASRSPSPSPLRGSPSPSPVSPSPIPFVPVNDQCFNATKLSCNTTVSGSTRLASFTKSPGTCGTTHTSPEVWYSITVPAGQVTLSMCNTANFDTKLTVWGGSCDAADLSPLQCICGVDDTSGCKQTSMMTRTMSAGTYFVMIHGFAKKTGDFSLTLTCPPEPESSTSPVPIPAEVRPSIKPTRPLPSRQSMPPAPRDPDVSSIPDCDPCAGVPGAGPLLDIGRLVDPVMRLVNGAIVPLLRPSPRHQNVIPIKATRLHASPGFTGSMYTTGLEDWGYQIGTQGQITSQTAADLSALAAAIDQTKVVKYMEGFHAHVMIQQSANFVLSTPNTTATVAVSDWGAGVTTAVVTSFIISSHILDHLHLTQDAANPILFACQVDRMDDGGHLLNSEPLALQVKVSQDIPFSVTLHSVEQSEEVDLTSAGGQSVYDGVCDCYNLHLPHTSLIVIRALPKPVQSNTENMVQDYFSSPLLGLLAIIPIIGALSYAVYNAKCRTKPAVELVVVVPPSPKDRRLEAVLFSPHSSASATTLRSPFSREREVPRWQPDCRAC